MFGCAPLLIKLAFLASFLTFSLLLLRTCRARPVSTSFRFGVFNVTLLALMLNAGVVLAFGSAVAFPACTRAVGACPPSITGNGYTCSNEYAQCASTKNCLTVKGFWFWESDCECKCVNTAKAEAVAEERGDVFPSFDETAPAQSTIPAEGQEPAQSDTTADPQ